VLVAVDEAGRPAPILSLAHAKPAAPIQ
jgi:hypothetical protein